MLLFLLLYPDIAFSFILCCLLLFVCLFHFNTELVLKFKKFLFKNKKKKKNLLLWSKVTWPCLACIHWKLNSTTQNKFSCQSFLFLFFENKNVFFSKTQTLFSNFNLKKKNNILYQDLLLKSLTLCFSFFFDFVFNYWHFKLRNCCHQNTNFLWLSLVNMFFILFSWICQFSRFSFNLSLLIISISKLWHVVQIWSGSKTINLPNKLGKLCKLHLNFLFLSVFSYETVLLKEITKKKKMWKKNYLKVYNQNICMVGHTVITWFARKISVQPKANKFDINKVTVV